MEKKHLEIGISTALVLLMVAAMLAVEMVAPFGTKSPGFVIIMLLFMIAMGFAGVKLIEM
jgi:hypothetical protein